MLQTRDLFLAKAKYDDWYDIYINLWCHDISAKYMLWNPTKSEEQAISRIGKTLEYQKKEPYSYFVYEKESGKAIGFAGMIQIEENVYEDTGIALGPAFIGKGYGKQILMALLKEAFDDLHAIKFIVSCRSANIASRKLISACGFNYIKSENRVDSRNGENYILELYEMKKDDYIISK